MIQQPWFWVRTPKEQKQEPEEVPGHSRSQQHYSRQPKSGRDPSIHPQMNGQCVVYAYTRVWVSLRKGGRSGTCYSTDGTWGHYAERNKPVMQRQILCEVPRVVKSTKAEHRMVISRWWCGGKEDTGNDWAIGMEFQFCKIKRVLETDGGDGCTTMSICLMSLNWTRKNA